MLIETFFLIHFSKFRIRKAASAELFSRQVTPFAERFHTASRTPLCIRNTTNVQKICKSQEYINTMYMQQQKASGPSDVFGGHSTCARLWNPTRHSIVQARTFCFKTLRIRILYIYSITHCCIHVMGRLENQAYCNVPGHFTKKHGFPICLRHIIRHLNSEC